MPKVRANHRRDASMCPTVRVGRSEHLVQPADWLRCLPQPPQHVRGGSHQPHGGRLPPGPLLQHAACRRPLAHQGDVAVHLQRGSKRVQEGI
eukprot:1182581-Prorocentrum_minimum.AAC.2